MPRGFLVKRHELLSAFPNPICVLVMTSLGSATW